MVVIKEDVQDFQFAGDVNLDYVRITEDVKRIGEKAFANCPNLVAIIVEESDTPIRICLDFVQRCPHLVEVSIKRKVELFKKIKIRGAKL